jgi:hypothetical protein
MRKTNDVKFALVFGLIGLAALSFALFPSQAIGQTPDTDGDGIPDSVEMPGGPGITLLGGQKVLPCTGAQNEDRHTCLDWQTPDLFVILIRANGCPAPPKCSGENVPLGSCAPLFGGGKSNIPSKPLANAPYAPYDPWELVEARKDQGGLGITTHEITASQVPASRVVYNNTSTGQKQMAVRLTESLNACGTIALGSSSPGTPNTTGVATLYTQRIINKIDKECFAVPGNCFDDSDADHEVGVELYYLYIQSLLVHELGHVMALTKLWTPDYGGPHEAPESHFIMEQKPQVKTILGVGGSVKWYISTDYSVPSKSDFKLK